MSSILRNKMTYQVILLFFSAVIIGSYYVVTPETQALTNELMKWGSIVTAILGLYGGVSALRYHGLRAFKDKNNEEKIWNTYAVILIAIVIIIGIGLGRGSGYYQWVNVNILTTIDSTMYTIIGFMLVEATLRGLRVRTIPAAVMVVCIVIMLLFQTPIFMIPFPWINPIGQFLQNVVASAVARAQAIGVGIAAFYLGLRVLAGREIGWLGGSKNE